MSFFQPHGLLAGFHSEAPEPLLPELQSIGEQWFPMRRQISSHAHKAWELYLQLDGVSRWRSRRGTIELKPGHLYAAPPGVEHRLIESLSTKHHFVFAIIDLDAISARLPGVASAWKLGEFITAEGAEHLEAPFRQLVREASMRQPHRAAGMRAALDAVVIEATRLLEAAAGALPGARLLTLHPAVQLAQNLIDNHPEKPWPLIELARLAGLSPNHLVNLFTHAIGMSPRQYLLRQRIDRAKHQLGTSDARITAIALDLGFSSSQHFAKAFARIAGCSARAWRERGMATVSRSAPRRSTANRSRRR
ncbi:MAG: helix-turn-helix transcriptional regulator [Planctomycetes bacterium]|nr:helix-turn-helix transcriptional regulator [Planctomycetota bacterium]